MTQLSLASNQAEARKFSRDARMRCSTPEPEVVRSKTPAVSRAWHRDVAVRKRKGIARRVEPELTLTPRNATAPDPRLVEFVRLLARHAAQGWYDQADKEQGSKRS
jgi:hypothetical protein